MSSPHQPAGPYPEAGWYPDPELRGVDRWWDGSHWTDRRRNTPENVKVAGAPHLTQSLCSHRDSTSCGEEAFK